MANGNTFGATLSSSYGGFWISFAVVFISNGFHIEDSMVKAANGSHVMFNNALALYLMVCDYLLLSTRLKHGRG